MRKYHNLQKFKPKWCRTLAKCVGSKRMTDRARWNGEETWHWKIGHANWKSGFNTKKCNQIRFTVCSASDVGRAKSISNRIELNPIRIHAYTVRARRIPIQILYVLWVLGMVYHRYERIFLWWFLSLLFSTFWHYYLQFKKFSPRFDSFIWPPMIDDARWILDIANLENLKMLRKYVMIFKFGFYKINLVSVTFHLSSIFSSFIHSVSYRSYYYNFSDDTVALQW